MRRPLLLVLLALTGLACAGVATPPPPAAPPPEAPPAPPPSEPPVPPDTSWQGATPLTPLEVLSTQSVTDSDRVSATLELHVMLQIHGTSKGQSEASRVCGDQILATMAERARRGWPAVVAEGLNFEGTYAAPRPKAPLSGPTAAERMTTLERLAVYGFESPEVQGRSTDRMAEMSAARDDITELSKNRASYPDPLARLDEIREDMMPANTEFVAAGMPLRSFQAIQTAAAVADARDEDQVAIVIGAAHWPDFAHAVEAADRLGNETFVGLRVVRYACAR